MSEWISKSEKKRQFKLEEEAAVELALLSDNELKKLPVGDTVKKEILNCRKVKGHAKNRQIKYLAKVMREESVSDIFEFLAEKKGSKLKQNKLNHEAERIRDTVINEAIEYQQNCFRNNLKFEPDWPGKELEIVLGRYDLDAGDFRRTIHQYVRTRIQNQYREIFRIVKAAIEKEELLKKIS
jgi:ribosome-associated protein